MYEETQKAEGFNALTALKKAWMKQCKVGFIVVKVNSIITLTISNEWIVPHLEWIMKLAPKLFRIQLSISDSH